MGKIYQIFLTFLFPFFLLATACSDDDAPPLPDTREGALMLLAGRDSKSWMLSKMRFNGANLTPFLKSCEKDNIYTFFRDGGGQVEGNTKKCTPSEADTLATGYWNLSEDLRTLTLVMGSSVEEFELIELTDEVLEMKKDIPDTLSYITYKKVH